MSSRVPSFTSRQVNGLDQVAQVCEGSAQLPLLLAARLLAACGRLGHLRGAKGGTQPGWKESAHGLLGVLHKCESVFGQDTEPSEFICPGSWLHAE